MGRALLARVVGEVVVVVVVKVLLESLRLGSRNDGIGCVVL